MTTDLSTSAAAAPQHENEARAKVYFPNLDALRTLAFLAVFLGHAGGGVPHLRFHTLDDLIFRSGFLGVSFFFVLSGFLITYLILTEIRITGTLDVPAFYARRCLRIWPLYYLVLLTGIVVYPTLKAAVGYPPRIEIGNRWLYPLFLSNFDVIHLGQGHGAAFTNITWSVAIEEQFYLVWPVLFLLARPRYQPAVLFSVILGSSLFRALNAHDSMALYFHSLSVFSDLAIGGLAAYVALNSPRVVDRLKRMPPGGIAGIYLLGLLLIIDGNHRLHELARAVAGTLGDPIDAAVYRLLTAVFFAFVVMEQNFAERSPFKMERLRIATRLGRYTYGLYLLHPLAIVAVDDAVRIVSKYGDAAHGSLWLAPISFALVLAMAVASYHLYEQPFLKLKRRLARVRSSG